MNINIHTFTIHRSEPRVSVGWQERRMPCCKGYLPRLNSKSNLKQPLPESLSTFRVPVYWPSARRNLSLYEDTSTLSPLSEQILNCNEHVKQCTKFNPVNNGFYLAWSTYKNTYIFFKIHHISTQVVIFLTGLNDAFSKRYECKQGRTCDSDMVCSTVYYRRYEGWNFNSGNYLFTTDTK